MNLINTIKILIDSKREGINWDFKVEPHDNNAELLHDIICLSNADFNGKRFLIFGVEDPSKGANIKGLKKDQANRKNQANFIDFLREKEFSGENRPELELRTINISEVEIDVLIIFDNPYKPYFLTKDYNDKGVKVKANYIYTRINDTNTPINQSADISKIEKMWRERFGLDIIPLDKMKILLKKPDEWFKDIGNKSYSYHKQFPEFRIEFSDVNEFWEVYSFFYTNHKSFYGNALFKYHSTTLFELEYIYCDEMRVILSSPKTECLEFQDSREWFYYYNLQDLDGIFLHFITDGKFRMSSRTSFSPFVIFKNDIQMEKFLEYLRIHKNELDNIKPNFFAEDAKKRMEQRDLYPAIDPIFVFKVHKLFEKWRNEYPNE